MITTYILPIMLWLLFFVIIALICLGKKHIKAIKNISITTVSIMFVPILYLFSYRIKTEESISIGWSSDHWLRGLLSEQGILSYAFKIKFEIDAFSMWLLIVINIVALVVVMLGIYIKTRHKSYYVFSLTGYGLSLVVAMSQSAWLILIGLFSISVLLFVMAGIWGKSENYSFTIRYLFLQTLGFAFVAISMFIIQFIVLDYENQHLILKPLHSYIDTYTYLNITEVGYRNLAVIFLVAGMCFLMPMVGFHRPIVDLFRHTQYPVLVILTGLYLPLLAYMFMKYIYVFFIDYIASLQPYIYVVAVIQIGVMAIHLWKTRKIKVWTSYIILASIPIVYILLMSKLVVTMSFAMQSIISFMLTSSLLLVMMTTLQQRDEEHILDQFKGLFLSKPYLSSLLVLTLLAISGLPLFSNFFAVFHSIYAVFDYNVYVSIFCIVAIFLVYINVFLHLSKVFSKTTAEVQLQTTNDLRFIEIVPPILLLVFVVLLGIYPSVLLEPIEQYVYTWLDWSYDFYDIAIWGTNFYWSLFVGDSIEHPLQYIVALISGITLVVTMWLASKQRQSMLQWVYFSASHFASVGLAILVASIDFLEVTLWKQMMVYGISVCLIFVGTHFLLSRHMYRSQYQDADHYQGLYYKNKWMYVYFVVLILTIIGFPTSSLSLLRFEILAQLFIERYIWLAMLILISFAFTFRPLTYWLTQLIFPVKNERLINKKERIEDWTWTNKEKGLVIGSVSINTLCFAVYILL